MFRFLFGKPTVEDWCDRIRRDPNPEKTMKCLVSDMSVYDKCTVLNEFLAVYSHKECSRIAEPNRSREKRKSMKQSLLWFESKLEESGHFEIVQIIRFFIFGLLLKEKDEEGGKEKKKKKTRKKLTMPAVKSINGPG